MNLQTTSSSITTELHLLSSDGILQVLRGKTFIDFPLSTSEPSSPASRSLVQLASGESHHLALLRDGRLLAWGRNNKGQLGVGDEEARPTPVQVPFPPEKKIRQIACTSASSTALTEDGCIYTWGDNHLGQLGLGVPESKSAPTLVTFPSELHPWPSRAGGSTRCA